MKTAPLLWMDNLNPMEKENIISWFNNKMDILIAKQALMKYNNPNNSLVDIVDEITKMAEVFIAPDSNSTTKEIEYFISITEDKKDITRLTYQYCLSKFDKTL